MTVQDFCRLALDEEEQCMIFSYLENRIVFEGTFEEAIFSCHAEKEMLWFEMWDGKICINIEATAK